MKHGAFYYIYVSGFIVSCALWLWKRLQIRDKSWLGWWVNMFLAACSWVGVAFYIFLFKKRKP